MELAWREKGDKKIVFLINYTEKSQSVLLGESMQNALTGNVEPAQVELPAFDVKVLKSK